MYFLSGCLSYFQRRTVSFREGTVSQPGFSPNFAKKCSITQLFRVPKIPWDFSKELWEKNRTSFTKRKKIGEPFHQNNFGEPQQNNISQGDSMGFTIFLNRQLTKEKILGFFCWGVFVGILRVSSLPFLPSFHKLHNLG